jgi:mRNA-degrading endonuclease toxin of MazEF toxin-antitoxin module
VTVGEIYLVDLLVRGGHAQVGRRPAIILQSETSLPTTLLIPLTTQLDALRFAGTVLVETDSENGLHQHSVALVFQLTAIDNRFISTKVGKVSDAILEQILSTLDSLIGR